MRKKNEPLSAAQIPQSDLKTATRKKIDVTGQMTIKQPAPANNLPGPGERSGLSPAVAGAGSVSATLTARATDEYVSSGGYVWLAQYIRSLPFYIDDITRDFGDDLYERMLNDEQVASAIGTLKEAVLAQGLTVEPIKDTTASVPKLGPGGGKRDVPAPSDRSKAVADFCRRNIDRMDSIAERPFMEWLYEMLDCLAYGNRLSEQVYEVPVAGEDMGRVCLKALKVKPRTSYAFVEDVYYNTLGIIGLIPGQGAPIIVQSIIAEPGQIPNLLPRDKFVVFTNRAAIGDPRGQSDCRPAYNPWWFKMQMWGQWLKYLTQFGSPSLIGITPQTAQPKINAVTGVPITPESSMLQALIQFQNGSAAAFPAGSDVKPIEAKGNGEAFRYAIEAVDMAITKAILYQTLATEEGQHESRAASQTHAGILDLKVGRIRRVTSTRLRSNIFRPLLNLNANVFGDDAATALLPMVFLGPSDDEEDFKDVAESVGRLVTAGYIHSSQYVDLDRRMGLPERDVEAQNAEDAQNAELERQAAAAVPDAAVKTAARAQGKERVGPMAGG